MNRNFKLRTGEVRPTEKDIDYPPKSFKDQTKKMDIMLKSIEQGSFVEFKLFDNTRDQEVARKNSKGTSKAGKTKSIEQEI